MTNLSVKYELTSYSRRYDESVIEKLNLVHHTEDCMTNLSVKYELTSYSSRYDESASEI